METAMEMISVAKDCGADAVKFQTFITEEGIAKNSQKAQYQKETTGADETQFEMVKKLELRFEDFTLLKKHADSLGIEFMSTPFDLPSIDYLAQLGMQRFKIPSGELVHLQYLRRLAQLHRKYVISTGMCEMDEIKDALEVFYKAGVPKDDIVILHANTQYPTPFEDVNLRAMTGMGIELGLKYGYSDHTPGIEVPVAAAALGACVIEKHFTLDKTMTGPDHSASLEPAELKAMISAVRNIEKALGDGVKKPSPSETPNKAIARKSLFAKRFIKKGELFTYENLTAKRPGTGISPMRIDEFVGKPADRDYQEEEML